MFNSRERERQDRVRAGECIAQDVLGEENGFVLMGCTPASMLAVSGFDVLRNVIPVGSARMCKSVGGANVLLETAASTISHYSKTKERTLFEDI